MGIHPKTPCENLHSNLSCIHMWIFLIRNLYIIYTRSDILHCLYMTDTAKKNTQTWVSNFYRRIWLCCKKKTIVSPHYSGVESSPENSVEITQVAVLKFFPVLKKSSFIFEVSEVEFHLKYKKKFLLFQILIIWQIY